MSGLPGIGPREAQIEPSGHDGLGAAMEARRYQHRAERDVLRGLNDEGGLQLACRPRLAAEPVGRVDSSTSPEGERKLTETRSLCRWPTTSSASASTSRFLSSGFSASVPATVRAIRFADRLACSRATRSISAPSIGMAATTMRPSVAANSKLVGRRMRAQRFPSQRCQSRRRNCVVGPMPHPVPQGSYQAKTGGFSRRKALSGARFAAAAVRLQLLRLGRR